MEETCRSILSAIPSNVPLIVDGDTGYGGPANLRRTIRNLAQMGVAAVTIEDQIFPKRCTYAAGSSIRIISREECFKRIRAAVLAREEAWEKDGKDILIVARTDCRAALGLEEAIERCGGFERLGADVVYAENLQSVEEYETLRSKLRENTIMMLAQVQLSFDTDNDGTSLLSAEKVGNMGFSLALFGVTALQATVGALRTVANSFLDSSLGSTGLVEKGSGHHFSISSFDEVKDTVGFQTLDDWITDNSLE